MESVLISDENKKKFIMGEDIDLGCYAGLNSYVIYARHQFIDPHDNWAQSILDRAQDLFRSGTLISLRFGTSSFPNWIHLTDPMAVQPFYSPIDAKAFDNLPPDIKEQLTEYIQWIYGDEGRAYVKRMDELKAFL
jgi:hypothetical protein